MFRRSQQPVIKTTLADGLLGALEVAPLTPLLVTPQCHLFVNDFSPNSLSVVADFTEATFAGYAASALGASNGPVQLDANNRAVYWEADFLAGAIVPPGESAYGYYVTNLAGTVLYWAERFSPADGPAVFAASGDFLSIDLVFPEQLFRLTP